MVPEHYFSENPSAEYSEKTISVKLGQREVTVVTSGGMFSPDHVDTGTKVLLEHIEAAPDQGNLLDIGCGWGPISLALAMARPNTTVWALDVNRRALEITAKNAALLGIKNIRCVLESDVPADLKFAGIWSNPPIRVGKSVLHGLLKSWLPRLEESAEAYLVVQKNLGADSLLKWMQDEFPLIASERIDSEKSFRVLRSTMKG